MTLRWKSFLQFRESHSRSLNIAKNFIMTSEQTALKKVIALYRWSLSGCVSGKNTLTTRHAVWHSSYCLQALFFWAGTSPDTTMPKRAFREFWLLTGTPWIKLWWTRKLKSATWIPRSGSKNFRCTTRDFTSLLTSTRQKIPTTTLLSRSLVTGEV